MHGEADLIGRLAHDLDGDDRGGRRRVIGMARISERLGDDREGLARQAQYRHRSIPILQVGRLRIEDECARPCPESSSIHPHSLRPDECAQSTAHESTDA